MFKALKLNENNLHLMAELVSVAVYEDYKNEFELNTEDGIETYISKQDYVGCNGNMLVYLYQGDTFHRMLQFTEPESDTEFKDVAPRFNTAKR